MDEPIYYGCKDHVGHYPWDTSRGSLGLRDFSWLDNPKRWTGTSHGKQGAWALTLVDGSFDDLAVVVGSVTVISCPDYTIDTRGGSHSTFLLPGHLTQVVALAAAREAFPWVFVRLDAAQPTPEED